MAEDIHWRKYAGRFRTFPKLVQKEIERDVRMIVCIPVCAEPDVISTLESLYHSYNSEIKTEVLLLFNKNLNLSSAEIHLHDQSWKQCEKWIAKNDKTGLKYLPVYVDELPDPNGGVGWARKMSMDEAARRLEADGIIVCLDADCTVSGNYLTAVSQHFQEYKTNDAVSIFYEHKIDHLDPPQRDAIVLYELHLRYLVNAQKWCGHPFAFSTIGSAMAVRRKSYLDQGGMNTRSAGEDFYFLQKFIEIGTYGEIRNTTVFPSARISSRVPFGTGRAMQQILQDGENWMTTDFQIFRLIKPLFQSIDKLKDFCSRAPEDNRYQKFQKEIGISPDLVSYLQQIDFLEECSSIVIHTANNISFRKRFFRYFNSFKMIKYMHYMRDNYYPDVPVLDATTKLLKEMKWPLPAFLSEEVFLELLRQYDREQR